jgi:aminoglycoside 3-N-acetyltransferase
MGFQLLKQCLPKKLLATCRRYMRDREARRLKSLPAITEQEFRFILTDKLGMRAGGLYMVHSSLNSLNLAFPPLKTLEILRDIVGEQGTLMFLATSKADTEMDFLSGSKVFNIKRTPTGAGLLSEIARRQTDAWRSLHPTKSVSVLGPLAEELASGHHLSPYPFDRTSPYGKFVEREGTVIGLGVTAFNLSIAHCVEDFMKEEFPQKKYSGEYIVKSIDYDGSTKAISVRASNPDITAAPTCMFFFNRYIPEDILKHHVVNGQNFFTCKAAALISTMIELARNGKTIYAPNN